MARQGTAKEQDEETGLYYYGARYLDPKYSMWISTDPALGEYIPQAPINDEAKKNNQNLPGMGGVFNHINSNLYHYAGNNPVRYIDPDGNFLVMIGLQVSVGAGTGATGQLGVYACWDKEGNCTIGTYAMYGAGFYTGYTPSGGLEVALGFFADEFDDVTGYSQVTGGSIGIPGTVFSIGGEIGINLAAKTKKEKLESSTIAFSLTAGVPSIINGEVHSFACNTIKLTEFKLNDKEKSQKYEKEIQKYIDNEDWEGLSAYMQSIAKDEGIIE